MAILGLILLIDLIGALFAQKSSRERGEPEGGLVALGHISQVALAGLGRGRFAFSNLLT